MKTASELKRIAEENSNDFNKKMEDLGALLLLTAKTGKRMYTHWLGLMSEEVLESAKKQGEYLSRYGYDVKIMQMPNGVTLSINW